MDDMHGKFDEDINYACHIQKNSKRRILDLRNLDPRHVRLWCLCNHHKWALTVYVHLFNWPVSPSLGWADPVKITASGKVLIFNSNQAKLSFVAH